MLATDRNAVSPSVPASQFPEQAFAWKQIVGAVEPFLDAVSHRLQEQIAEFEPDIAAYARYALDNQGKQLRPALVALSANATGDLNDSHVSAAVIVEMVHLATLVHDDVMDGAALRRGRPTLAARWGNEISVLTGDCLFAHALKLAASFPTPEICRLVAAATNTVCSGEILQTQWQKNFEFSKAEYFRVLEMKTGALFGLSCELGAYLSGAGAAQRQALREYGLAIGTAYQVYDDCVDLFGSEAATGKSLGRDLAKGKLTLPILLLLERVREEERVRIQELVEQWQAGNVCDIMHLLRAHRTLGDSQRALQQYLQAARQALSLLADTKGRSGLLGLAAYIAQQTAALAVSA